MHTRFHFDRTAISTLLAGLLVGFLLMFVPVITSGSLTTIAAYLVPTIVGLGVLWFGFVRGSYITIDSEDRVYGTLFFAR